MFNEKTALIAAFFLAVSPFHIWYSQEVRMYALQWLLALISFLFFLRTLEQPRLGNYAAYMLSVIAGLYTLQLNIFLMVIHGAYLLVFFKRYKTQILKWAGTFCLIIAFYIPYILFTYNSLGRITPIPRQMDYALIIPYTLFSYFGGFSIGPSLRELHFNQTLTVIEPYIYVVIPLLVLFGVITALGLFSTRKNHQNLLLLILMMIVPIIGAAIVIELTPTLRYNVRYTGMALFGFLIALAKGVDWISDLRPMKLGIILSSLAIFVLGGFSAYSYANYQFDKKYQKADIRGAAAFIKENRMPDDAILCIENIAVFNRYTMPDFECRTIPETVRKKKELVDIETADILEGKKRLWLVLSDDWYSEHLVSYIKYMLDARYKELKTLYKSPFDFANTRIYCYDLAADRTKK